MSKVQNQEFSNRWGLILASLGMAIGAGNLWRFPRLAGQYGGSFILLWILFLLVWSIPLLLAEFSIGKKYKRGVIGSIGLLAGRHYTWMGFFITICTLGIAFYYSVVSAWSIEYLGISIINLYNSIIGGVGFKDVLHNNPDLLNDQWLSLSNHSITTIAVYILVVLVGVFVVGRGVKSGLEKANRILIPSLFVLLIIVVAAALSMEGGLKGLEYMFAIKWSNFENPTIWIEALSQSAWSTGAGWGLMITITSYSRSKEDVTLNTFIGAFGNNTASILAGAAILPAVFALSSSEAEALNVLQSGSQSLTFLTIPALFSTLPGGELMTIAFFAALSLAAFSSFLPMLELMKTNLKAYQISDKKVAYILIICFVIFGFPSAYSLDFFSNQDWVWGLGLILSGVFIAFITIKYGADRFKSELIDIDSDMTVSSKYFKISMYLNVVIGIFLIYWWMSQGFSANTWFDENGFWNVFDSYSNASIITQWVSVILTGILINKFLNNRFCK